MSNGVGNTKDLNTSRAEDRGLFSALQGLLDSLGDATGDPSPSTTLSTAQLRKLSDKFNGVLGDSADQGLAQGSQPGQLLNEDGLPIINISEPLYQDFQTSTLPLPAPEHELIPVSLLPPDERERRRRERDHILDLLEEEERLQQLKDERDAEEERKEALRKRKESAKAELEQLKASRALQKKMGQALVRDTKGANGNRENGLEENVFLRPPPTSSAAKKSVSFADAPAMEVDKEEQQTPIRQVDWGDVIPGRLRAHSRLPLVSTAEAQKSPMKMHVVERRPIAAPTSSTSHNGRDSDDESTSSAGCSCPRMQSVALDEEDRFSSRNHDPSDEEPLEEEFDYDSAQHHREIALEYHRKRHAIGAETAKAMAAHTLDDHEHDEIPNGQLPLSRFRADRMTAAYDKSYAPVSTSMGPSFIPASRQNSLRKSVRLGKLENDQLMGEGSGESGSENETIREVIHMLKTGSMQNAGPDFDPSSLSSAPPSRNADVVESSPVRTSSVNTGP